MEALSPANHNSGDSQRALQSAPGHEKKAYEALSWQVKRAAPNLDDPADRRQYHPNTAGLLRQALQDSFLRGETGARPFGPTMNLRRSCGPAWRRANAATLPGALPPKYCCAADDARMRDG